MAEGPSTVDIMKRHPRQIACTMALHLLSISSGVAISSTSVILHKLLDDNVLTPQQGSWFASIFLPGLVAGCFVNGIFATKLGPKTTAALISLTFIVGFLANALGNSFWILCIGRVMLGIGTTGVRTCLQPFVCEFSHPGLRGLLGSLYFTLYSIGYATFIPLGHLLNWRLALMLSISLPVTTLICSFFMHESPTWLLGRRLEEKAADALRFYERPEAEIQNDLESIKKCIEKQLLAKEESKKMSFKQHLKEFSDDFLQPNFLKPLLYLSVALAGLEWSSFPVLAYYLVMIFEETHSTMNPYLAATVVAFCRIVWTLIGNALVVRVPRRVLFLVATPLMALSLCALATYCWLTSQPDSDISRMLATKLNFVPLLCIMCTHFFFATGFSINTVLVGEIFPSHLSNIGASATIFVQYFASFLAISLAPPMKAVIGLSGLFYVYAAVAFSMFVFGAFFMPETKGLSLREIQEKYYAPKKKDSVTTNDTADIAQEMITKL